MWNLDETLHTGPRKVIPSSPQSMPTPGTQDSLSFGCSYGPRSSHTHQLSCPMRFSLPGLPSPDKAWEASQTVFLLPRQPRQEGLDLTRLLACEASGLPSEAQVSLLQSGQMLRHLVGHRDSIQSSDFEPSSDCLVSHTTSAQAPSQ